MNISEEWLFLFLVFGPLAVFFIYVASRPVPKDEEEEEEYTVEVGGIPIPKVIKLPEAKKLYRKFMRQQFRNQGIPKDHLMKELDMAVKYLEESYEDDMAEIKDEIKMLEEESLGKQLELKLGEYKLRVKEKNAGYTLSRLIEDELLQS